MSSCVGLWPPLGCIMAAPYSPSPPPWRRDPFSPATAVFSGHNGQPVVAMGGQLAGLFWYKALWQVASRARWMFPVEVTKNLCPQLMKRKGYITLSSRNNTRMVTICNVTLWYFKPLTNHNNNIGRRCMLMWLLRVRGKYHRRDELHCGGNI